MLAEVLILDDQIADSAALKTFLSQQGYEVSLAFSQAQAEEKMQQMQFELVIVESASVIAEVKNIASFMRVTHSDATVLAIVNSQSAEARIAALETGADDCISLPYHPRELLLRMKKLVRLKHGSLADTICVSNFSLNIDSGNLVCPWGSIILRKKEFMILSLLMQYRNQVVTKEQLIEKIWSIDDTPLLSTIDVHVRRIRQKLRDNQKEIIKTSYGVGYMFCDKTVSRC